MKLAGRITVEPLDDERLTRIERRIVAGAVDAASRGEAVRMTRPLLGRALAIAGVMAAGVLGWMLRGAPASGPIVDEPAAITARTSQDRSVLDIGDARIASDPDTVFAVTRPGGGVLVAMTRGKVELEVGKRGARPPLIVRAGDTDVVVVGTRFSVDYGDGRGEVDVRVTEGAVRVVHQRKETRVAGGQAWRTRTGLHAAVAQAEDRGVPAARSTADEDGGAVARDEVPIAAPPPPELLHDRTARVPGTSVAATVPPRSPEGNRPQGESRLRAPAAPRPAARPLDLRTAIRAQPIEPALDLGEPDAASAIAKYYEIAAHRSGDAASQAFYSIAVVRHLRQSRNPDALQTLDAYVRRFPGGKEYRAALWLRVRILCLARIDDRCRAAAYTFLHEAPDAPAARVAEQLTLSE